MAFWDKFKELLVGVVPGGTILSQPQVQQGIIKAGEAVRKASSTPTGKGIISGAKKIGGAIGEEIVKEFKGERGYFAPELVEEREKNLQKSIREGLSAELATQTPRAISQPAFDPLLEIAAKLETEVLSPYVKRPISTVGLLTDPESPLYENGPYGKGLQASDIQAAYDRSKDVSLGVALTKSYLNPMHLTGISDAILESGGVDIERVNLWDDKDIQKNFVDNTTGRWLTGFTDFLVGEAAVFGAASLAVSGVKTAARAAGLSNKLNVYDVNAIKKLEELADDHLSGKTQTAFGTDVVNVANSTDVTLIRQILKPHTNNERIIEFAKETTDPAFVRDLILADKGYAPSLYRLMNSNRADDLWYISNAADEVAADFLATGIYRSYNGAVKERWNKAFDDAIAKNPETERIYNAFMRDQYDPFENKILPEPRYFGKAYKPIEPVFGARTAIAGREALQKYRAAAEVKDFSNVGGVVQTIIGSGTRGGAATALITFTNGKLPRGIITHSGLRPGDAVEELNAWLDEVPLFRNGANQIKLRDGSLVSAADYRRNLIDEYFTLDTDVKRAGFFQRLNDEAALDILDTMGVPRARARDFLQSIQTSLYDYHGDLSRDSFAMDPSGVRVVVDPQSQRQLANATPLIPMGKIIREVSRVKGRINPTNNMLTDAGRALFETGNKLFSLAQLVRPAYIPKNSIFEPMLAALMSLGSKFITDSTKTLARNAVFNNKQRFNAVVNKANIKGVAKRKAIKEEYGAYLDQYEQAVQIVDNSVAEWVQFFMVPNARSPVAKAQYADFVKDDLRAAERLIDNLEQKMRRRAREFGFERQDVPSLYGLTRRVQYLKSLKDPKIAGEVRAAELAITKAAGDINTLAPDLNRLDAEIKKAYDKVDEILVAMGPTVKNMADEFSVVDNAKIRRRGRQEEENYIASNGQVVKLPRLEDERYLGTSYKAEISNRNTKDLEILGDKVYSQKTRAIGRQTPNRITDVTEPSYFDELAYYINYYMRGDVLIDQILAGRTRDEIIQTWGLKRGGRSYANDFGRDPGDIIDIIDDRIAYVNRYIPTPEAKAYAIAGEVRGNRLAQLLGDKLDQLTPINPLDNQYSTPVQQAMTFLDRLDKNAAAGWRLIGAPENAIRWAWGSVELRNRTAQKIDSLASQGYEITDGTINSVRQAAAAEMVQEAEKTFYSVRRQNRAVFASRTVLSFPAAALSGLYRYTRFAAKSPQRMAGFLNAYYATFNSFGVDRYGNPVEDPLEAEFLLVPGTKELGLRQGRGIILGTRALNFLAGFAGPSYIVPISIGTIVQNSPTSDQVIKEVINKSFGKIPGYSYEELFPFGVQTDVGQAVRQTFTPSSLRNLITAETSEAGRIPKWLRFFVEWISGPESKQDWIDSVNSEWNYQMVLYEMGIGKAPTEEQVFKKARNKYLEKALWQFASPLGTPAVVETRPDSLFSTYFRLSADKYKSQGFSNREAKQKAEQDLNAMLAPGVPTEKFPMPRLNYGAKAKPKATYIVSTPESVERIWDENKELAKELGNFDPKLVGLIVGDLADMKSDPTIARVLSDPGTLLPDGTTKLNLDRRNIQQVEQQIQIDKTWAKYSEYKRRLNKAARDAQYSGYASVEELRVALQNYAENELRQESPEWYNEYSANQTEDTAYKYAWGLTKIIFNEKFMEKHGNTQYWSHVRAFLKYRNDLANLKKSAPSGYKSVVVNAWRDYVASVQDEMDPSLGDLIDRVFENDNLREVKLD